MKRSDLEHILRASKSVTDQTFGYYADEVSPDTARLPHGCEERLIRLANDNTGGAIGW